ncbi:HNH endonuclease [Aliivibrio fischeri]|uniref:HNH endonuclease n=1 Tax=Aliivibrio fischeri SR5 TaxID=1088719 RepID=A0AAV3ELW8_ALIFS|nr:HNH endonuclease [Aliivibrio fischeri]EHN67946.1 HNH endonuclease [Aliivibrio fischeri SR5]
MFEVGQIYNRCNDIHGQYKGQQYGGIATPALQPYVFIFTSDAGESYGYSDGFGIDDTFWYTGEGQTGDMQMTKGNLAILNHQKNGKEILLFESVSTGYVRFCGICSYVTHHIEQRLDKNSMLRDAFIFHLEIDSQNINNSVNNDKAPYLIKPTKSKSLKQLRDIAIAKTPAKTSTKEKLQHIHYRSEAIKLYAKKRAKGICEACHMNAPFEAKSGPYLEVHHLTRLADGGSDTPENVIALCPTCHRKVHYSIDKDELNNKMIFIVQMIESSIA